MDTPAFDEIKELARHDPEGFERLRQQLIDDFISRRPENNQRRLRARQFVIETRRQIAGNPVKALLVIQAMMYDSALGLQQTLADYQSPHVSAVPTNANVLPFQKHSQDR